jgi:hypothetical protein
MMMSVEQSAQCELSGEIEVFGENLPQYHFVHHNPTRPDLEWNSGRRGGKPATNLSYGMAQHMMVIWCVARSSMCRAIFVEIFG